MLMPNSVNAKSGFGNTFKSMICNIKKVDSLGGPNEPEKIVLEKSRQEPFTVQETWRPVDGPVQDPIDYEKELDEHYIDYKEPAAN